MLDVIEVVADAVDELPSEFDEVFRIYCCGGRLSWAGAVEVMEIFKGMFGMTVGCVGGFYFEAWRDVAQWFV